MIPHSIPFPSACLPVGRGKGEGEGEKERRRGRTDLRNREEKDSDCKGMVGTRGREILREREDLERVFCERNE